MKFFKTAAALLFVLSAAVQSFAITVTVTPPGSGSDWDAAIADLGSVIEGRLYNPKKFTKANANAASYANHAATQRGYAGYEYFALTVGAMAGAQLPSSSFDDLKDLNDSIRTEGDAKIGFSTQFAIQLGMKAWFVSDDLYLGLKIGQTKLDFDKGENEFKYGTFMLGLTANYMLLNRMSIGSGAVKWRGLNFGTGLIYQSSDTKYTMKLGRGTLPLVGGTTNTLTVVDPYLKYKMNSKIVTIPLELTTAMRLLYCLNFTAGFGADLAVGKTDVRLGMDGDIQGAGTLSSITGTIEVAGKTKSSPSIMRPKFISGIGIDIGETFIIDVPFTLYFGNGFDVGITLGTLW
ncbi:MAG: hypothetical protein FWG13_07245 [Leptospirales bacterium]|nr:hypothetical protein [Leptospirales bacterium]